MKRYKYVITKSNLNEGILDTTIDIGIDLAGLIPGIGEGFDLVNTLRYIKKARDSKDTIQQLMNYFYAGMSLISMIPSAGDLVGKVGKWAVKIGSKGAKASPLILKKISMIAKKVAPSLEKVSNKLKSADTEKMQKFGKEVITFIPQLIKAFTTLANLRTDQKIVNPESNENENIKTEGTILRYKSITEAYGAEIEFGGVEDKNDIKDAAIRKANVNIDGQDYDSFDKVPLNYQKLIRVLRNKYTDAFSKIITISNDKPDIIIDTNLGELTIYDENGDIIVGPIDVSKK